MLSPSTFQLQMGEARAVPQNMKFKFRYALRYQKLKNFI